MTDDDKPATPEDIARIVAAAKDRVLRIEVLRNLAALNNFGPAAQSLRQHQRQLATRIQDGSEVDHG